MGGGASCVRGRGGVQIKSFPDHGDSWTNKPAMRDDLVPPSLTIISR